MSYVYVCQVPQKRDPDSGTYYPAFNISPASEHGEIRVLMPSRAAFLTTETLVPQIRTALRAFTEEDSLLTIGDPVIVAVTTALLATRLERFHVLRWDRHLGKYARVCLEL